MNTRIIDLVPACAMDLIRNWRQKFHVPIPAFWTTKRFWGMRMDDAEKFRQYAAECRRLAEKSSAKDKAVLLEIADAWIACAERAASLRKPSHK